MASGYDISVSASDSTTQSSQFGKGAWTIGGNESLKWLPLALVALAALYLFFQFKKK